MPQFSIPVIEYSSARPGSAITPSQPFVVNDRQLLIAMVRSTLTVNSGRASRKYMAAIVKPTMQFLLDWGYAPNLRVSGYFLDVLRDFSVTMRIGELAQGVSYAYWKWQRGYSWIADFGPWVAGLTPHYAGRKSPDFVMLNLATNDLAVMESKGTGSDCHKTPMGSALRQCRDAIEHPAFSRGFGSVLTLDSGNPAGVGTLHIRDPASGAEFSDELMYYLFRRSYASWFDLVGDDDLADWCRQGIREGMARTINRERIDQGHKNLSSPLRAITAMAMGFDPERTSFEIDPMVADAIVDFELFKRTEWHQFSERMQKSPENTQRLLWFPDGTRINEY